MNTFNPQNPVPNIGRAFTQISRFRKRVIKAALSLLAIAVAGVAGYSIYVAVHEPDPQETVLLGQAKLAAGCPAAFRLVVRNRVSEQPVKGATVTIRLADKAGAVAALGTFHTDESGSLAEIVNIPDLQPGEYQLIIDSSSAIGRDHIIKKLEIQHPARILLSSDKPIYQPGQVIHLRSLILNERTQKPFAREPVTFEVSDPKGNKVFKETHASSAYGIASADFALADELNLGRYEIRALAGSTTGERTIEVKQYVLPKFRVKIATDRPYYLPGQTVSGTVHADYFFGKPAENSDVKLTISTLQEQPVVISKLGGRTDANGQYGFQFVLPDFFAGMPQKAEQAFLDLSAEVTDSGQHEETKTLSLSVAQNELEITAIPEAGALVPGVENLLYVLTSYPDGRPAVCKINSNGGEYHCDAEGVCAVRIVPNSASQHFEIQASDAAGRKRNITFVPDSESEAMSLLLRTDQAVYRAGQMVRVSVLSPEKDSTVFVDVIKDGQTVLTKAVPLNNHHAEYAFNFPASLVGALTLNAYVITDLGEDRGCSRTVYVNPASDLQIAVKLSKTVYRPGETAKVDFTVTDATGQPAQVALGLVAVDESVFALAESRPGLLQQFLDVEADLMKPRYQIKSFDSPADLVEGGDQTLAQAYFASFGGARPGPDLDTMEKNGYLPDKIVEHIRSMRGTPQYESLRNDPEYAAILQTMEGEGSLYNLRDITGPTKFQAVESQRKAYFSRLKTVLLLTFLGSLLLLPVFVAFHGSPPVVEFTPKDLDTEANRKYVAFSTATRNVIGALILFSLALYPIGGYFCDRWDIHNAGWVLLASEAIVVMTGLLWQLVLFSCETTEGLRRELNPLRTFLGVYVGQFVLSRLLIVLMVCYPRDVDESLGIFWFLGSVIAPIIVLWALDNHIRGRLVAKGIKMPEPRITVLGVVMIIAAFFVLASMLLPALASAKRKAQSISLLNDVKEVELAGRMAAEDAPQQGQTASVQPRIRRDFPETLFWRPEFITDDHGEASLEIPLADSITTWRTSIDGVSASGKMGSVELPITVFQDFFADLDLPVSLSLGDQMSVPVTCYNYLKESQDIRLTLAPAAWFESSLAEQTVRLGAGEVKSVKFPIKALRVGTHSLRVTAQGLKIADAIEREVQVMPVGDVVEHTKNDVLKAVYADSFTIPNAAILDSQSLWIKLYPSRFSEVVEGLDSIFREPYGCFEQTSSTTYPNVLALDYLKRMGRLTPELEIKARKLINAGYQRLLTFEVPGGGFEWFGRDPAHVGLTAYGIMEFTDMNRVQPVDQAMMERTKMWIYSRQNADGSWDAAPGLDEWGDDSPVTAYVSWALAESGDDSPALDRGLNYLRTNPQKLDNNYQRALAANALLAHDRNDAFGLTLLKQLKDESATMEKDMLCWPSQGYGLTYSHGFGLEVETTSLCTMAMIRAGLWPESVKAALTWLSRQKTSDGTWGSTQATILAMRALILGSTASLGQEFDSEITVLLNGEKVEAFHINESNSDVMKQINLTKHLHAGENRLELRQTPAGELPVQITGKYWLPSESNPPSFPAPETEHLQIAQQYDRTKLAVNDQLKCAVTVRNNIGRKINMAIVDLGIPPGFDVDPSAFEAMQQNGQIAKFETTGNQVILYLRELSESTPLEFSYSLRAKYPLRVQSPPSSAYEYYEPTNRALSQAVELQVAGAP